MQKIKIVTDSASDIPQEDLEALGIEMLSIPIAVDGKGYFERKSFSIEEFYDILDGASEIPVTSRIPEQDYFACYRGAMEKGYTHLINVTINASGSGVNAAAHMARDRFYADIPGARQKLEIHIVDSGTYSLAYGWPTMPRWPKADGGRRKSSSGWKIIFPRWKFIWAVTLWNTPRNRDASAPPLLLWGMCWGFVPSSP